MQVKTCPTCNEQKPLTAEHFAKNSRQKSGWWCYCKPCEKNRRDSNRALVRSSPEKLAAYRATKQEWAKNNKDKVKVYKVATYTKHRDRTLEERRNRYKSDDEYRQGQLLSVKRAWEEHGHKYSERQWLKNQSETEKKKNIVRTSAWRKNNPEKFIALIERRRSLAAGASGEFSSDDVFCLLKSQHGLCCYCGTSFSSTRWTIDHLIPLSRGGSNEPSNLALACRPCNSQKGNKTPQEYKEFLSSRKPRRKQGVLNHG